MVSSPFVYFWWYKKSTVSIQLIYSVSILCQDSVYADIILQQIPSITNIYP